MQHLITEADRVLCHHLVMFFNCLFPLDVQNESNTAAIKIGKPGEPEFLFYVMIVCLFLFFWLHEVECNPCTSVKFKTPIRPIFRFDTCLYRPLKNL